MVMVITVVFVELMSTVTMSLVFVAIATIVIEIRMLVMFTMVASVVVCVVDVVRVMSDTTVWRVVMFMTAGIVRRPVTFPDEVRSVIHFRWVIDDVDHDAGNRAAEEFGLGAQATACVWRFR